MKYKQEIKHLMVPKVAMKSHLRDRRTGLEQGTLTIICQQHSVKTVSSEDSVTISGQRDQIQKVLEKIHWAGIPYRVL